jgi:hypothetical protein
LNLAHFPALLLFALAVSTAFAFMMKPSARERALYVLRSLFYFVFASIAIAWLMYAFER